jgi:transposase
LLSETRAMSWTYRNRQQLEHRVVIGHERGESIRGLSVALQISRNTVRRILRKHKRQREQGHSVVVPKTRTPRARKLDPYVEMMNKQLEKYPNISGERMFEKLKKEGYDGGRTQLRERLRELRPRPKRTPHIRFETEPSKQGQFDWSPYRVPLLTGGKLAVLCFSYILAFSRRHFINFTLRRDFFTLIRRHVEAFEYFGGVPQECLYDSEKTVVLRWEATQPIYNPTFLAFITHYNCRPIACTRGKPRVKGKIERPFQYVEGNLLNARKFHDLEDLRQTARWWMANRSDLHKHDTTGRPPLELFVEQEAAALQPLPRKPYDTAEVGYRVCGFDGFVEWETNRYSVDYEHVGDILAVKAAEDEIIVYGSDLRPVAHHERKPDGARHTEELTEHRHDPRVRYGLEPVREGFEALGPEASAFLTGLSERHRHNPGFHARRILLLRERYHSDDIHRALQHAARYLAFDATAVERVLRARFRPRTLEQTAVLKATERLEKQLPRITQRALSDYQQALRTEATYTEQSHDDD